MTRMAGCAYRQPYVSTKPPPDRQAASGHARLSMGVTQHLGVAPSLPLLPVSPIPNSATPTGTPADTSPGAVCSWPPTRSTEMRVLKNFHSHLTVIFISVAFNEKMFDLYFKIFS